MRQLIHKYHFNPLYILYVMVLAELLLINHRDMSFLYKDKKETLKYSFITICIYNLL